MSCTRAEFPAGAKWRGRLRPQRSGFYTYPENRTYSAPERRLCGLISHAQTRESAIFAGTRSRSCRRNTIRFRACCRRAEVVARGVRRFPAAPWVGRAELAAKVCTRKSVKGVGPSGLGATRRIKRRFSSVAKGKYKLKRERHGPAPPLTRTAPASPAEAVQAPVSRPQAKNIWQRLLDFLRVGSERQV